jgi:hypothetical protein
MVTIEMTTRAKPCSSRPPTSCATKVHGASREPVVLVAGTQYRTSNRYANRKRRKTGQLAARLLRWWWWCRKFRRPGTAGQRLGLHSEGSLAAASSKRQREASHAPREAAGWWGGARAIVTAVRGVGGRALPAGNRREDPGRAGAAPGEWAAVLRASAVRVPIRPRRPTRPGPRGTRRPGRDAAPTRLWAVSPDGLAEAGGSRKRPAPELARGRSAWALLAWVTGGNSVTPDRRGPTAGGSHSEIPP